MTNFVLRMSLVTFAVSAVLSALVAKECDDAPEAIRLTQRIAAIWLFSVVVSFLALLVYLKRARDKESRK